MVIKAGFSDLVIKIDFESKSILVTKFDFIQRELIPSGNKLGLLNKNKFVVLKSILMIKTSFSHKIYITSW